VSIDIFSPVPQVIVFQYNPDSLTRSLQPQVKSGEGACRSETLKLSGPPIETINLDAELDATDDLDKPHQNQNAVHIVYDY
jgi:hypothetical protein